MFISIQEYTPIAFTVICVFLGICYALWKQVVVPMAKKKLEEKKVKDIQEEKEKEEQNRREKEEDARKIAEIRETIRLKFWACKNKVDGDERNFFGVLIDILDVVVASSIPEVAYVYVNFISAHFAYMYDDRRTFNFSYIAKEIRANPAWKWKVLGKFLNDFELKYYHLNNRRAPTHLIGKYPPPLLDPRVMEIFNGN